MIRLVGALAYRTSSALTGNKAFMAALSEYEYADNCAYDGAFHLWHFPGPRGEIAKTINAQNSSKLKFPAILNFLPIREVIANSAGYPQHQLTLNLAIAASTLSDWTTQQREVQTFDLVLRPIYREFMRQIALSGYFMARYGDLPHEKYEVYTTGGNQKELEYEWGEHIDVIEVRNLTLILNPKLCDRDIRTIEEDNRLLTTFN